MLIKRCCQTSKFSREHVKTNKNTDFYLFPQLLNQRRSDEYCYARPLKLLLIILLFKKTNQSSTKAAIEILIDHTRTKYKIVATSARTKCQTSTMREGSFNNIKCTGENLNGKPISIFLRQVLQEKLETCYATVLWNKSSLQKT